MRGTMALSKKPYKGTRDFFPAEKRILDHIFSIMKHTALNFGYEPYDGPLLEEVELYKAKSGEELINDQIYSFIDRGDRFVAIRPEMTPTLARMVAQVHKEYAKPVRWFSIPNLMRYEKPQRGRLREHWQLNCDIFGAPEISGEIEILSLAISLMNNLGANEDHFEILLNDRAVIETTFRDLMKLNSETTYKLYKIVDRSKKVDQAAVEKMLNELLLTETQKYIFFEYINLKSFNEVSDFLKRYDKEESAKRLINFSSLLDSLELSNYIKYDPAIVRGLDYYTGIVFEIFDKHPDNRRAICGGGSYANLLSIFNETPIPGVGFGLGDVTLTDFLKTHNLLPDLSKPNNDLFLTFQNVDCKEMAFKLANNLRKERLNVVLNLDPIKFKKVFPLAQRNGSSYVGFLGETEFNNKTVQLKDMITKEQATVNINEIDKIKSILKG